MTAWRLYMESVDEVLRHSSRVIIDTSGKGAAGVVPYMSVGEPKPQVRPYVPPGMTAPPGVIDPSLQQALPNVATGPGGDEMSGRLLTVVAILAALAIYLALRLALTSSTRAIRRSWCGWARRSASRPSRA